MKEKILTALTAKFEGVKAELLERIAAKAAKTINTEEEITTYIEGVTIQQVIDAEGDRRATDAQKTAVANYEKKYNLKEGKAIEKTDPKPTDPPTDDVPAWAKALIESNKAMADRLNAMDGERTTNSRKSQLDAVLKNAPEKVRTRFEKDFQRFNFKDDDDFNAWIEETKTDVEAITADFTSRQGIVTPPKTGGKPTGQVSADVQARIDAQAQQTTTSAIKG